MGKEQTAAAVKHSREAVHPEIHHAEIQDRGISGRKVAVRPDPEEMEEMAEITAEIVGLIVRDSVRRKAIPEEKTENLFLCRLWNNSRRVSAAK